MRREPGSGGNAHGRMRRLDAHYRWRTWGSSYEGVMASRQLVQLMKRTVRRQRVMLSFSCVEQLIYMIRHGGGIELGSGARSCARFDCLTVHLSWYTSMDMSWGYEESPVSRS